MKRLKRAWDNGWDDKYWHNSPIQKMPFWYQLIYNISYLVHRKGNEPMSF